MTYLTLTPETLGPQHICCAFSDRRCEPGTAAKKSWLRDGYAQGYRFRRLDARAKVFIEFGPAATFWAPVEAPDCLAIGCFWVSGRHAGQGYAKALLADAILYARDCGLSGLIAITGAHKWPFMSDGKWLKRQGFTLRDTTPSGFHLLALDLGPAPIAPRFIETARRGLPEPAQGVVVYYSDRCPYTALHIRQSLTETCARRGLALTVHHIGSLTAARAAPTPATIFSLFLDGRFVTTDLSVCMDSRFDRITGRGARG